MILYFASMYTNEFSYLGDVRRLIAYPYINNIKDKIYNTDFIDSGAYSAYTLNIDINIDNYIKDLKKWHVHTYAGLDVIGNAEKTKQNCDYMKNQGLNPIPTYHFGEDISYLHYYCKNYDYIALGGVAQLRVRNKVQKWLNQCFSVIKQYWPIKVHGFAITSEYLLEKYPFYSVDSTGWLASVRFNRVLGIKNQKIYKPLHYKKRLILNIKYYLKLQNRITELWQKRGIYWKD